MRVAPVIAKTAVAQPRAPVPCWPGRPDPGRYAGRRVFGRIDDGCGHIIGRPRVFRQHHHGGHHGGQHGCGCAEEL